MKFELVINMDGKGFATARMNSLLCVLDDMVREIRKSGGTNGAVKDWYGDPVGTWAIVSKTNF